MSSSIYTDIIARGDNFKDKLSSKWTALNSSISSALSTFENAISQTTIEHNQSAHLRKDVDEKAREEKAIRQIAAAEKDARDKVIQAAKAFLSAFETP